MKRDQDSTWWDDPENQELGQTIKLMVLYFEGRCDHAGVLVKSRTVIEHEICGPDGFGRGLPWDDFFRCLGGRYQPFDGERRIQDTGWYSRRLRAAFEKEQDTGRRDKFLLAVRHLHQQHFLKGLPSPFLGTLEENKDKNSGPGKGDGGGERALSPQPSALSQRSCHPELVEGSEPFPADSRPLTADSREAQLRRVHAGLRADGQAVITEHRRLVGSPGVAPTREELECVWLILNEGYTVADCHRVLKSKWKEWREDKKMRPHFMIPTLFNPEKFPGYLALCKPVVPGCSHGSASRAPVPPAPEKPAPTAAEIAEFRKTMDQFYKDNGLRAPKREETAA